MLKIVANVSKKVPIEGVDFSSQSFMAGMEVEVSDGATEEQVKSRIAEVYRLLTETIDAEIAKGAAGVQQMAPVQAPAPAPAPAPVSTPTPAPAPANGNGKLVTGRPMNGNGRKITEAQQKACWAISKSMGWTRDQLLATVRQRHGVESVEALSVRDASTLIDFLQLQAGNKKSA